MESGPVGTVPAAGFPRAICVLWGAAWQKCGVGGDVGACASSSVDEPRRIPVFGPGVYMYVKVCAVVRFGLNVNVHIETLRASVGNERASVGNESACDTVDAARLLRAHHAAHGPHTSTRQRAE